MPPSAASDRCAGKPSTAGLGLDNPDSDAYPAVLQRMADSAGVRARVVNAGLSGETSAGALRRADWLLREKADAVVIETGANDGLRGLDPDSTAANLRALIGKIRAANPAAKIMLVQMEAPTNLGALYTRRFHALFPGVASAEDVTDFLTRVVEPGDLILVKGSRGVHLETVVEALRAKFELAVAPRVTAGNRD